MNLRVEAAGNCKINTKLEKKNHKCLWQRPHTQLAKVYSIFFSFHPAHENVSGYKNTTNHYHCIHTIYEVRQINISVW